MRSRGSPVTLDHHILHLILFFSYHVWIVQAEISLDEQSLVTAYDNNVKVTDWQTGALVGQLFDDEVLNEDTESLREVINCFCVHPEGDQIVVATQNFLLRHWRLSDRQCIRSIRGHTMPVLAMTYDPTGTLVATGSADRSVRVWDIGKF
jgi:WD40 repeat protein